MSNLIDFYIFWLVTSLVCGVSNSRYRIFGLICLLAWVSFYVGFRPLSLGSDTESYSEIYNEWDLGIFDSGFEYSFSFLFYLFSLIGVDYSIVQFFLSFIFFLLVFVGIYRVYGRDAWISFVFIFSFTEVWAYSINILRYGLAFSVFLFFLAFSFASDKLRPRYLISAAVVSIGFHYSVVVLWFLYLLFSNRLFLIFRSYYFVLVIFSFCLFLLGFDFISFFYNMFFPFFDYLPVRISSRVYEYFDNYDFSALNLGFSYILVLLSVFLSSFYYERFAGYISSESMRLIFFKFSFVSSVVFLVFYPLFFTYDVFARVLSGFGFFSIFLLFEIIMMVFTRSSAIIVIFLTSFLLFSKLVFLGFSSGFLSPRFL